MEMSDFSWQYQKYARPEIYVVLWYVFVFWIEYVVFIYLYIYIYIYIYLHIYIYLFFIFYLHDYLHDNENFRSLPITFCNRFYLKFQGHSKNILTCCFYI